MFFIFLQKYEYDMLIISGERLWAHRQYLYPTGIFKIYKKPQYLNLQSSWRNKVKTMAFGELTEFPVYAAFGHVNFSVHEKFVGLDMNSLQQS